MSDRESKAAKDREAALCVIDVDGLKLHISNRTLADEPIQEGDLYVGKRNTGWQLGTFRMKSPEGWIYDGARPGIYPFNDYECRKVLGEAPE